MDVIVGTAGHIDHGKTALIRALTGTDTDRLPEEKKRGITIDLGFAELTVGDVHFGFVDVPGHERFVKNMLAGASGIDLVLLVVAADEGIMPQTREHFDICRLLQIKNGLVAITKRDTVDDEMLDLVRAEVSDFVSGTFLDGSPIVAVSARTGDGIEQLCSALVATAGNVKQRQDDHIARLAIDRSFAMRGFGTVVTGTLASGSINVGDDLELVPAGERLRVRGLQSHGKKVAEARSGRRTAVNLAGIDHHEIARGMQLADPGILVPTQIVDAYVEMLPGAPALKTKQRVRVHIGTAEALARVSVIGGQSIAPGEAGFAQLRLESPVASILGERFILRSYSPQFTIGGGSTLDPAAEKLRLRSVDLRLSFLSELLNASENSEKLRVLIAHIGECGIGVSRVRSITGWTNETLTAAASVLCNSGTVREIGGYFISSDSFERHCENVVGTLDRLHKAERLARTVAVEKLRTEVFRSVPAEVETAVIASLSASGRIAVEGDGIRLAGRSSQLSEDEQKAIELLLTSFENAGLEVARTDEVLNRTANAFGIQPKVVRKLFQQLLDSGDIVRISPEFAFSGKTIEGLVEKIRAVADKSTDRLIDVAKFKEVAGVSRKYAIPLLEYLDLRKITARRGDKRLIL